MVTRDAQAAVKEGTGQGKDGRRGGGRSQVGVCKLESALGVKQRRGVWIAEAKGRSTKLIIHVMTVSAFVESCKKLDQLQKQYMEFRAFEGHPHGGDVGISFISEKMYSEGRKIRSSHAIKTEIRSCIMAGWHLPHGTRQTTPPSTACRQSHSLSTRNASRRRKASEQHAAQGLYGIFKQCRYFL